MLSRRHLPLIFVLLAATLSAAPVWQTAHTHTVTRSGGTVTVEVQIDVGPDWVQDGFVRFRVINSHSGTIPQDINDGTSGALRVRNTKGPTFPPQAFPEKTPYGSGTMGTFGPDIALVGTPIDLIGEFDAYGDAPGYFTVNSSTWTPSRTVEQTQEVEVAFDVGTGWTVGKSKTGTATGAEGGNQYNFAIVSGDASIAGNSATGAFTVTANGAGAIQFKVWASAGNGYARSNDAIAGGSAVVAEAQSGDPAEQKTTAPQVIKNTYPVPLKITYTDDVTGELLMTRTLQPGETLAFSLAKNGDNNVRASFELQGDVVVEGVDQFGQEQNFLALGGNSWTAVVPDSSFSETRPTWEASQTVNTSVPTSQLQPVSEVPPGVPTTSSGGGSTVVVQGNAGAVQYSSSTAAGGATDATVREGTGAIVTKLGDLEKAIQGQNAQPVTVNVTGVENRLDTANASLDEINAWLEAQHEREELKNQNPDVNALEAAFNASTTGVVQTIQQKFQQEWSQHVGDFTVGTQSAPEGGQDWPSFTVPILGEVVLSPYELPWLIPILNGLREFLLWLMVGAFVRSCVNKINDYSMQVATVPQVNTTIAAQDLVPVGGQFLSWAKGLLTAAGIITFVVIAYGIGIGMINTSINFQSLWSGVSGWLSATDAFTSAMGSNTSNPFWELCKEFFPLGAFLSLAAAEIAVTLWLAPVFLLASFIVRAVRA